MQNYYMYADMYVEKIVEIQVGCKVGEIGDTMNYLGDHV